MLDDPSLVKKAASPPSSYILWMREKSAEYSHLTFAERGRVLGQRWRSMSEDERYPWDLARERLRQQAPAVETEPAAQGGKENAYIAWASSVCKEERFAGMTIPERGRAMGAEWRLKN
jgi:hypothetical protein